VWRKCLNRTSACPPPIKAPTPISHLQGRHAIGFGGGCGGPAASGALGGWTAASMGGICERGVESERWIAVTSAH
jgi:hypothetical protein